MSAIEILRKSYLSNERHEPRWQEELSNAEYHAIKTHVSSSCLRKFPKSGKAFFWAFNSAEDTKECQEFGTAFHQAVLEPDAFEKMHAVMPKFEGHANSNVYREQKAAWLEKNKGRTILKSQERFDEMRWMRDSLNSHPDAVTILKYGYGERSGFYIDPQSGVPCKIRHDWLNDRLSVLADIKTTRKDIGRSSFQKTIWKERFDISLAMYSEGIEFITGKPVLDTAIIVVQTVKPYECAVYPVSKRTMQLGSADYHWSLSELSEALKTNVWPPAQSRMQEIEHPSYVFKEYSI